MSRTRSGGLNKSVQTIGSNIYGTESADNITVKAKSGMTVYAAAGDDNVSGGIGSDVIYGDALSADSVTGGTADGYGFGHDNLTGGQGNDTIYGQGGDDNIAGQDGDDQLYGGNDHDQIAGGSGNDQIWGGTGNDQMSGGEGDDVLDGGDDLDTATYSTPLSADMVTSGMSGWLVDTGGSEGADSVTGTEILDDHDGTEIFLVGHGGFESIADAQAAAAAGSATGAMPDAGDTILTSEGASLVWNGDIWDVMSAPDGKVWLLDASGDFVEEYGKIQQAVDDASADYTVFIGEGTFTEDVTIAKDITVKGMGSPTQVVGSLFVESSGVAIENLDVDATGKTYGIELQADAATIYDGVSLSGVSVSGATYAGVELHNNVSVTNMSLTDVTLAENGVGLRSATGVGIDGLTLSGCLIADNLSFGILTNNGGSSEALIDNITIDGTTFSNNGGDWTGPADNVPNNGDLALFSYSGTALTLTDLTFATETRSSIFVGGTGQDIDSFVFDNIDVTSDTAFRVVKLEGLTASGSKSFAHLLAGINAAEDYEVFAEISGGDSPDTIIGTDDVDLIKAAADDDQLTGAGGDDYLQGGAGIDTAHYDAALDASMVTMVADAYPYTVDDQIGWQVATGAGEGTDLLTGIEILDGTEAGRILLVGNGGYATIQEAVNAADAGDTVLVADGNYNENVLVGEGIKLQGLNGSSKVSVSSITINPLAGGSSLTISGFSFANDSAATAIRYNGDYSDTQNVTINIDDVSIANYDKNGIAVFGGGTCLTVNITDSQLTGNGDGSGLAGGKGDVLFYNFLGNVSMQDVSVTGNTLTADHGISFTGWDGDNYSASSTVVNQPMGAVSFDNVTVSGSYAKTLMFIQAYNDFPALDVSGLTLGSATGTQAGWTALYIDPTSGVASYTTASDGVTTVALDGLTQLGGTFGWGIPNLVTGTPDGDAYSGSDGSDVFFCALGADTLMGGDGADVFSYAFAADSTATSKDVIADFKAGGDADIINLDWVFAGAAAFPAAITAASLALNGTAAEFADNKIAWWIDGANTQVYVDVNGDNAFNAGDMQIQLSGQVALVASDFII